MQRDVFMSSSRCLSKAWLFLPPVALAWCWMSSVMRPHYWSSVPSDSVNKLVCSVIFSALLLCAHNLWWQPTCCEFWYFADILIQMYFFTAEYFTYEIVSLHCSMVNSSASTGSASSRVPSPVPQPLHCIVRVQVSAVLLLMHVICVNSLGSG